MRRAEQLARASEAGAVAWLLGRLRQCCDSRRMAEAVGDLTYGVALADFPLVPSMPFDWVSCLAPAALSALATRRSLRTLKLGS